MYKVAPVAWVEAKNLDGLVKKLEQVLLFLNAHADGLANIHCLIHLCPNDLEVAPAKSLELFSPISGALPTPSPPMPGVRRSGLRPDL
jgi:hypothetical protein